MYKQLLNKINKGYSVNFFSYKEEGFDVSDFENVIFRGENISYFYSDMADIEPNRNKDIKNHFQVNEAILKNHLKNMVENTIYNKEYFKLIKFQKDIKNKVIYIEFKKI